MSEGLEDFVRVGENTFPRTLETPVHSLALECSKLGYQIRQITDYVKACIYVGFSPTSEGAVRADLNISHELFKACVSLLQSQGIVSCNKSTGKYSWTWKGLFSRNENWSLLTPWRIGLLYALAEKEIPKALAPPERYRDITLK